MRNRLLLPAAPALACLALAAPAAAATPEAVSENWSGYEATTGSSDGFSAVLVSGAGLVIERFLVTD
jgi:hypothetical protein